jgi:hypothetical protein
MNENTIPDILRTNIESVFINLLISGINFLNFDFIEPPTEEQTKYTMNKLILYDIIPQDFSIFTDVNKLDLTNAKLYSNLSYIPSLELPGKASTLTPTLKTHKLETPTLEIPLILLHILLTYKGPNTDFLIQIILINSMYLSYSVNQILGLKKLYNNRSNLSELKSQLLMVYSENEGIITGDDFKEIYKYFKNLYDNSNSSEVHYIDKPFDSNFNDILIHINSILMLHGHICENGVMNYCDNGYVYSIYFEGVVGDRTNYYTFVSSNSINNMCRYNLLSANIN